MAEGVRIQHATERSTRLVLVDQRRPYPQPLWCEPPCATTHTFKAYHLDLDESGACIVSREIVERIKALPGMGGFRVANAVPKPPPQRLVIPAPQRVRLIPMRTEV
jgi:hypothetical protein